MRKLRVVFTTMGGAVPALLAAVLVPVVDACGGHSEVTVDASAPEAGDDASEPDGPQFPEDADASPDVGPGPICPQCTEIYLVDLPPPGVVADPGQICAVAQAPVSSNTSARVTLTKYMPSIEAADGFIAIAPAVAATIVSTPKVTVVASSDPKFAGMQVSAMSKINGGYRFIANWPGPLPHGGYGASMTVKVAFTISCADGGTQTVESITKIDFCVDGDTFDWVSSGDSCTICCTIIAEMAPSPIVSDNRGDDLPLGRVIRIRVVEVARAGRQVLLFAENDAGDDAQFEWRISGGTLDRVADDVMLWSMPDEGSESPFGQVAVWNEAGAVVENFLWGAA